MKKTVYADDFVQAFDDYNCSENFSKAGRYAMYAYFTDLEASEGEEMDLDVIALCCEYSEYPTAWEAMEQYQPEDMPTVEDSEGMDLVEIQEAGEKLALEWLENQTMVIPFDGGVIIQNF